VLHEMSNVRLLLTFNMIVAAAGFCAFLTPALIVGVFQLLLPESADVRTHVGVLVYLACLAAIAIYAARGRFRAPERPHLMYWIGQVVLLMANAGALLFLTQVPAVRRWLGFSTPVLIEEDAPYLLFGLGLVGILTLWLIGFVLVRTVWEEGKTGGYGARPYRPS
jgi:uncharacterized membrane protein YkvI